MSRIGGKSSGSVHGLPPGRPIKPKKATGKKRPLKVSKTAVAAATVKKGRTRITTKKKVEALLGQKLTSRELKALASYLTEFDSFNKHLSSGSIRKRFDKAVAKAKSMTDLEKRLDKAPGTSAFHGPSPTGEVAKPELTPEQAQELVQNAAKTIVPFAQQIEPNGSVEPTVVQTTSKDMINFMLGGKTPPSQKTAHAVERATRAILADYTVNFVETGKKQDGLTPAGQHMVAIRDAAEKNDAAQINTIAHGLEQQCGLAPRKGVDDPNNPGSLARPLEIALNKIRETGACADLANYMYMELCQRLGIPEDGARHPQNQAVLGRVGWESYQLMQNVMRAKAHRQYTSGNKNLSPEEEAHFNNYLADNLKLIYDRNVDGIVKQATNPGSLPQALRDMTPASFPQPYGMQGGGFQSMNTLPYHPAIGGMNNVYQRMFNIVQPHPAPMI